MRSSRRGGRQRRGGVVASIRSTAQMNFWDSREGDEEKRPIRSPQITWQLATGGRRGGRVTEVFQNLETSRLEYKFTQKLECSHYLLTPKPMERGSFIVSGASKKISVLLNSQGRWGQLIKYKMALYSSSGVIQVSGSPEIYNWCKALNCIWLRPFSTVLISICM